MALGSLAFLASWLVPNHYLPWTSFHNESVMFLALGLLAVALLAGKTSFQIDGLPLLTGLLALVIVLQWQTGLIAYHGDAALSGLYLAGFALAWWAAGNAASEDAWTERLLAWMAALLVCAAAMSVYVALLQWLGMEAGHANLVSERENTGRPGGNLGQPNHLATLLLMGTASSVLLYALGRIKIWQLTVLVVWLALGLTMAESRASWLAAALMGALYLYISHGRKIWSRAPGPGAIAAWWTMLSLMWFAWKPVNEALLLTATRGIGAITQDSVRLVMWRQLLSGIEQSPWWGYGWRQTVVGQKAGSAYITGAPITDYAHSLVLDLCLWVGVPLAIVLTAGAAWWLLRAVRRISDLKQLLLVCSVVPVLVHSLVEFPFAYSYFLFTTGGLLGVLNSLQSGREKKMLTRQVPRGRLMPATFVLLFAGLSTWAGVEYAVAEDDFRVMRFEMRNVGQRPPEHKVPDLKLLDQLGEILALGRVKPAPGMDPKDIERLRVASDATMWATAQMRYAVALGLNGNPEEATRQLRGLRAYYGESSYRHAKALFLELQQERYPELTAVRLP